MYQNDKNSALGPICIWAYIKKVSIFVLMPTSSDKKAEQLVAAAQSGDHSAWNMLYERYYPGMYAISLHIFGSAPVSKDVVQDTFVQAYLKLKQLQDHSAFGGWLKQILLRICYKIKSKQSVTCSPAELTATDQYWEDELSRKHDQIATNSRLYHILTELPETLHNTVLLRYFSRHNSYDDIAKILGIPIGTVRSRLNQAKIKMEAHWRLPRDTSESLLKENEEWNYYYESTFGNMHMHDDAWHAFRNHLEKDSEIIFTSGKRAFGSHIIENEMEEDRKHGSWFAPDHIYTSGNLSVIELTNFNSPEHPFRCPARGVFVMRRNAGKVNRINFHLSN